MSNDPSAIATWANLVTVTRLLVSPVMFAAIDDQKGSWFATGLWFVLCVSDLIDGSLARRHGATRSGAFLDPLADKVLVLGAMFTLVQRDVFWLVPVLIIAVRELVIQLYRTFVGAKGVSVPATKMAKYKTFAQQCAVGFAVLPLTASRATWTWQVTLWLSVALTTLSGIDYLVKAQRAKRSAAVIPA